jgi:tetratricopeptide (TPR) repeat protein
MSRSIHRTRRDLEEVRRSDFADAQEHEALLEQIDDQLEKKRRIKDEIWEERQRGDMLLPPTPVEAIPILVQDEDEFVHYPASPEDIRAVMRRLPVGVMDGIQSITLCLGMDRQEDEAEPAETEKECDPFTGRVGGELWPGVFSGHCLGVYRSARARILLCAYVYESRMPDREIKELYLRLRMLSTFAHEVAHHFDKMVREARGRWWVESGDKAESYAETMAHQWVRRYVAPYLEEAYPEQLKALNAWHQHHGGVALPLSLLAGDHRGHCKVNGIPIFFNVCGAFETLMEKVAAGEGLVETRLGFARDLHYGEHYAEALAAIDSVLSEHPDDAEALTLQADIYVHQERYDEAAAVATRVLERDETDAEAWEVLTDVYAERRDWPNVWVAATHVIDLCQAQEAQVPCWVQYYRARARFELDDLVGLEPELQELERAHGRWGSQAATALRAVQLLRANAYEDALRLALSVLAEGRRRLWLHELAAVQFEAAHRLGRPGEAGELSAETIRQLRDRGYEEWMDRLAAEYGIEAAAGAR